MPSEDGEAMEQEENPIEEMDAGSDDAGLAGAAMDVDASEPDGSIDWGSGGVCTHDDVGAWAQFHKSSGLVTALEPCGEMGCTTVSCPAATCIQDAAHLRACEECPTCEECTACTGCTEAEGRCVVASCPSACGKQGNDAECRACICEAGCVDRFNACARVDIRACSDVYGREAREAELTFVRPLAYRQKNGTGLVISSPLLAYPHEGDTTVLTSSNHASLFRRHGSAGFTHLVSLEVGGRPYLLEHKSRCGDDLCIARISPALPDGSFGRAAYVATWSKGWDEIEAFRAGGQTFLLRHKTGDGPVSDEPKGQLRIDRVERRAGSEEIILEPMFDEPSTPPSEPPWSSIEAFNHAGATHLLFHGTDREGEVKIARVRTAPRFELESASAALHWTRGWDVVETFPLSGRALVLLYKSGRSMFDGEAAGTVRVLGFSGSAGQPVSFTTALHQSSWPERITNVVAYQDGPRSYLLRSDSVSGATALIRMNEATQLASSLGETVMSGSWSATPPWDVIEVVRQQPW